MFAKLFIILIALASISMAQQPPTGLRMLNSAYSDNVRIFPKLAGYNIGAKNYDDPAYQNDLSKLDLAILGFYKGWSRAGLVIGDVLRNIKRMNPDILLGQYTILNESYDDPNDTASLDIRDKLYAESWWLLNADGQKVQWTSEFDAWEVNFSRWTKPDGNGLYYPEWLAQRNYNVFFEPNTEFDICYFDNVFGNPRVTADWDLDGFDDSAYDSDVINMMQEGHVYEWQHMQSLKEGILIIGNADNDLSSPVYRNKLNGCLLEALMGLTWSKESRHGWHEMMDFYHSVFDNLLEPKIVIFNVWGQPNDYKFLRYALASSLLNDGYFCFTDENVGYSSVPLFDEYEIDLGIPLDPPQYESWQDGVYKRTFSKGMVLVNPDSYSKTITIGEGYKRIQGSQDPQVNNGQPATGIQLRAKDGIILIKE